MLVDTSNRLLANTLRARLEPAIQRIIDHRQRGFFHHRAMLANILEVEPQPVPYTHLRAHETVLDPECRLLFEKKK